MFDIDEFNTLCAERYNVWLTKVKAFAGVDAADVLNDLIVYMAVREIMPETDYYVVRACRTNYISNTSNYNRERERHFKFKSVDELELDPEDLSDELTTAYDSIDVWALLDKADDLSWWEKECFKRKYLEGQTLKQMSEDTGLTIGQVYYSINKVKKNLKKIYEKENEKRK